MHHGRLFCDLDLNPVAQDDPAEVHSVSQTHLVSLWQFSQTMTKTVTHYS